MPFLDKFVDPDFSAKDTFHTSGYASAASNGMGAGGGGLSMAQRRQQLRKNDRIVQNYRASRFGLAYGALKARAVGQSRTRAYDASTGSFTDGARYGSNRQQGGVKDRTQIDTTSINKRQQFIEPPGRNYNPYG